MEGAGTMREYRYTRIDLTTGKSSSRTVRGMENEEIQSTFYRTLVNDPRVPDDDGTSLASWITVNVGMVNGTSNSVEPHMDGAWLQFDSLNGISYMLMRL